MSVTKLTTRARDGIGFDITIQNLTGNPFFIRSTRLKGRIDDRIAGESFEHDAFTYDITLNSYILAENNMQIEADVSEPDEKDWVIPGKGQLTYEFSTDRGHELWEYELSIVTPAEVSPDSRTRLRLLFRRGKKKVTKEVAEGSTAGSTTLSRDVNEHSLALILKMAPPYLVRSRTIFYRLLLTGEQMGADAAWIALGSAVGGGVAGGIATFWGSVVINRYQFIKETRTRLYRDVMPPLMALDFRALTTQTESYEPLVAKICREASLCKRTDRRIARDLFTASANVVKVADKARRDSPDGFAVLPEDRIALDSAASVMSASLATLDKHLQRKLE